MSETIQTAIDARTRYCAVYGHPVQHSASPPMQNAALAALGLNWKYLAFDVPPSELAQAVAGAKAMRFIGLNLTVPHKLLALDMVDHLDDSAAQWRAINTIRFEARDKNDQWRPIRALAPEEVRQVRSVGFNTDADAIVQSVCEDLQIPLRGGSILVLGAGGAGSVAALRLAAEGVSRLYLVNRTAAKAEEVANEVRRRCPGAQVTVGYPPNRVDLVLNATSLGLKPDDPLPFDRKKFALTQAEAAYDMIYRPAETQFLAEARAAGRRVSNGVGMLLYQGARALEIWAQRPAPIAVMKAALTASLYG